MTLTRRAFIRGLVATAAALSLTTLPPVGEAAPSTSPEPEHTARCYRLHIEYTEKHIAIYRLKLCDHPEPLMFLDDPFGIRVTLLTPEYVVDVPSPATAGYRVQCESCRRVYGAWTEIADAWDINEPAIRDAAMYHLATAGFMFELHYGRAVVARETVDLTRSRVTWTCAGCLGRPGQLDPLTEGVTPAPDPDLRALLVGHALACDAVLDRRWEGWTRFATSVREEGS